MRKRLVLSGVVAMSVTATIGLGASPALAYGRLPGTITRVDAVPGGAAPRNGAIALGISTSGRYVLWSTEDTTVVPGRSTVEYYVTDTVNGLVTLVSKSLAGQPLTGDQYSAALSANGRYVVYVSNATGLPHPGRPAQQSSAGVYRYDLQTGDIRTEDLTAAGGRPWGGASDAGISATGRYVAFSMRTGSLPGGAARRPSTQLYLHDNVTQSTILISKDASGAPGFGLRGASSFGAQISADGRYVAFLSNAENLGAGHSHAIKVQALLWDRDAPGNGIINVSHGPSGAQTRGSVFSLQLSADGTALAYVISVRGSATQVYAAYRYDIATGKRTLINAPDPSRPGRYAISGPVTISADGRYLGYSQFNALDRQPSDDYRYDSLTGKTQVIYRAATTALPGPGPVDQETNLVLSGDGRHAAFDSNPPPFSDPGDTNGVLDVYEWNGVAPH